MKFVAIKTVEQLDLQALHRVRERLVCQRTSVINQIRAFLLERGIAVRQGPPALRSEIPIVLSMTDKLSPRMIQMIEALCADWRYLDERIENVSDEIKTLSEQDDGAKRLMTVPGIGPIISTATVAATWARQWAVRHKAGLAQDLTRNQTHRHCRLLRLRRDGPCRHPAEEGI
jgi:transposase